MRIVVAMPGTGDRLAVHPLEAGSKKVIYEPDRIGGISREL